MIEIVGILTWWTKDQGTYTRSKAKYTMKEIMHNIILQEEEVSILGVDTEDEDEEEVWAKAKDKLSVITACSQDT